MIIYIFLSGHKKIDFFIDQLKCYNHICTKLFQQSLSDVGAFVFPEVIEGITEASTILKTFKTMSN